MPGIIRRIAQTVLSIEHAFVDAQETLINGKSNGTSSAEESFEPVSSNFKQWNHGLFGAELTNSSIFPRDLSAKDTKLTTPKEQPSSLAEGTYHGTRVATTEMMQRIEARFDSFFDVANYEPTIPQEPNFDNRKKKYTWQEPGSTNPPYPPCLAMIPKDDQTNLLHIFNFMRLLDTGISLLRIVPPVITDFIYGDPMQQTMAACVAQNAKLRAEGKNIGTELNVADSPDWYTDAVFAQQSFTGPNPTSITLASLDWISKFADTAKIQGKDAIYKLLTTVSPGSLYIQDYSYFRAALGVAPDAPLTSDDGKRVCCAAVTLFQLDSDGSLHPLGIVLDYLGSMEKSVVIFNQRLSASDPTGPEYEDWPWRYAKMCNQVSDWTRHELSVHLVGCHFIEEASIVAAHRSFSRDHVVYKLLEPHWFKTLSLNAAARQALVPHFINEINGFKSAQTYTFIQDAYNRFDWQGQYVPNDLETRGFPESRLGEKVFHNYAYAKNMSLMWSVLRNFVSDVLKVFYKSDADIQKDIAVSDWSEEMRSPTKGQIPTFPGIKTLDQLIDAVTMCIHIASPQHNAVNYLQDYYMSFVPSKPSCLMSPMPRSLQELNAYREADMMAALPINDARIWLMAAQLPYLLSYGVEKDQTLLNYAKSLTKLHGQKTGAKWAELSNAAESFYAKLVELGVVFRKNSDDMDRGIFPYHVMDPSELAVSLLL